MTYSAAHSRGVLVTIVTAINELLDTVIDEAREIEAHDAAAATALREHVAAARGTVSHFNQVGAHLCDSEGTVCG